jgi:hypothetical protein
MVYTFDDEWRKYYRSPKFEGESACAL